MPGGALGPGAGRKIVNVEGRVNSQADALAMTPRLHQQNSLSSQRMAQLNDSYSLSRGGHAPGMLPSERSSVHMQRSSAEQSEIVKEVNRHTRVPNSNSSSYDRSQQDPEAVKRSMQQAL